MIDIDKLLGSSPSPRLSRAKQVLESQKSAPKPLASLDGTPYVTKGEAGGPKGPDPTRYGDWERNGRCIDF
jgi:hypothetical protein